MAKIQPSAAYDRIDSIVSTMNDLRSIIVELDSREGDPDAIHELLQEFIEKIPDSGESYFKARFVITGGLELKIEFRMTLEGDESE